MRGYNGLGGGPLPFGLQLPDRDGPWNTFTSPSVTTTRGFGGRAMMSGGGVQVLRDLGSTMNLTLRPDAAGGDEARIPDFRSSSMGVGFGWSWVVGNFELVQ